MRGSLYFRPFVSAAVTEQPPDTGFSTYEEAAALARKSVSTIRRWRREGKVIGGHGYVKTASLLAYLDYLVNGGK
jgi:hypothetical protein